MFGHDIIVIGASAGGVDALPRLIGSLPADLPASIFVVLHIPAQGRDMLPEIIRRTASLSVAHGVDGERVRKGHVYVAPPDHHLQVDGAT
jgi:two-component system chemotaxis response regulator CheB